MVKVMAKKLEYEDNTGAVYNDSYWVPRVELDKVQRVARLTVQAWVDEDARNNGKSPFTARRYTVTGDEFDTFFSVEALNTENVLKQAYLYLDTTDMFAEALDV